MPLVPAPLAEELGGRHQTVDMGNPHLVIEVADPDTVDLSTQGAWLEQQFADGINVEFVARSGDDELGDAVQVVLLAASRRREDRLPAGRD